MFPRQLVNKALGSVSDAVQLTRAIEENRVCLSRNHDDFEELHFLIEKAKGQHSGILVVRRENDPTRDLTVKGIVTAIRKLESAGVPIANEYIVLQNTVCCRTHTFVVQQLPSPQPGYERT